MKQLAVCVFPFVMMIIWIEFTEGATSQNSTGEYKVNPFPRSKQNKTNNRSYIIYFLFYQHEIIIATNNGFQDVEIIEH